MPNPNKKFSKARRNSRRANYYNRLDAPSMTTCTECGEVHQTHRACAACGTYRGRQIIAARQAAA